jgi:hypothetical protein
MIHFARNCGGRAKPIPKPLRVAMKADQEAGGAA